MFLETFIKSECFGCEGCAQVCPKSAIRIIEDDEGFRYPEVENDKCIDCGLCKKVCAHDHMPLKFDDDKYVFGGYNLNSSIRFESTSGGAFSAIVESYFDSNCVIFGAESKGLLVYHTFITDIGELGRFRKSKYSQSVIGSSYNNVKKFLESGKKVIFSGTPCQNAGLLSYLDVSKTDRTNLLTIEVVCEGVPSPLYIRKLDAYVENKYGSSISSLDYRFTDKSILNNGRWDFEVMRIELANGNRVFRKDRWFNPFWSIWLQHLMSRPSCYKCSFTTSGRVSDITLGDLWGVHIYCPELYGKNGGSSLVVCNTVKGKEVFSKAKTFMYGHDIPFEDALRFQGPMKKSIADNPKRDNFIRDLRSDMDYLTITKKWSNKPSFKLLIQKYLWGNRQKVFFWNIKNKL